jgi:hypothetical protein
MMVNIDDEYFCATPSLARRIGQVAGLPKGAITITLPRSHSKCMRFRGQRHGLVFRLLWSSLAPGHLSTDDALPVLSAGRTCSRSAKPQVPVHKGDMPLGPTESTLLLTNRAKPIIINSFHRGRGARICGLGFPFCRGIPWALLGIKEDRGCKKEEVLIPRIRGYIFHGKATRKP